MIDVLDVLRETLAPRYAVERLIGVGGMARVLTIEDLTSTFHPYPTLSEGIKLAAQTFTKHVAKLSCCAA